MGKTHGKTARVSPGGGAAQRLRGDLRGPVAGPGLGGGSLRVRGEVAKWRSGGISLGILGWFFEVGKRGKPWKTTETPPGF